MNAYYRSLTCFVPLTIPKKTGAQSNAPLDCSPLHYVVHLTTNPIVNWLIDKRL